MGARVYLPIIGRFLQVDPVEGGTDNNYVYANDPVNEFDLDGRWIRSAWNNIKKAAKWTAVAGVALSFIPGSIGIIGSGIAAASYTIRGEYGKAAISAISFMPAGRLVSAAVSKSRIGARVLTRTLNWQAKLRFIGTNSRLFGSSHKMIGKRSGLLNRRNNIIKIGWSHKGTRHKGHLVYRIGWKWRGKSYHIDYGRARRLW